MKISDRLERTTLCIVQHKGDIVETLAWGTYRMPKSLLFEKLLDLALPIVKSYRSDLYHDAQWIECLDENVGKVFYFAVRETGTWIGSERNMFPSDSGTIYRITVTRSDDNRWEYKSEQV